MVALNSHHYPITFVLNAGTVSPDTQPTNGKIHAIRNISNEPIAAIGKSVSNYKLSKR